MKNRLYFFGLVLCVLLAAPGTGFGQAQRDRIPSDDWMRFSNVEDAGFDPAKLEAARVSWEGIPSSAFLVVVDGAVVASWGDVERRFMCHSVRKSFLSGLYGIYWDKGEIELNKTLADLGIDDEPLPLLETEKRARILDLLKARSGVFHPAAYAGRTDSRPRGSEGPGRYFAYNNWDFNTSAAILKQETGADVFEAFDEYFGQRRIGGCRTATTTTSWTSPSTRPTPSACLPEMRPVSASSTLGAGRGPTTGSSPRTG